MTRELQTRKFLKNWKKRTLWKNLKKRPNDMAQLGAPRILLKDILQSEVGKIGGRGPCP